MITSNVAGERGGGVFECLFAASCGRSPQTGCESLAGVDPPSATSFEWRTFNEATSQSVDSLLPFIGNEIAGNIPTQAASDAVKLTFSSTSPVVVDSGQSPFSGRHVIVEDIYGAPVFGEAIEVVPTPSSSPDAGPLDGVEWQPTVLVPSTEDTLQSVISLDELRVHMLATTEPDQLFAVSVAIQGTPCVRPHAPGASLEARVSGCGEGFVNVGSNLLICQLFCPPGTLLAADQTRCLPCPAGTLRAESNHQLKVCSTCPPNTYSFAGASSCTECPPGGDCSDPSKLLALPGFWFALGNSSSHPKELVTFIECSPAKACPGGDLFSVCAPEYSLGAFACSACKDDFAKVGDQCIACPSSVVVILCLVAVTLGLVAFLVVTVRTALSGGAEKGERSIVLKILINTVQTYALLLALHGQQSDLLATTVGTGTSLMNLSLNMVPIQCLVSIDVYQVFALTMAVPPAIIVFSAVVLLASSPSSPRAALIDSTRASAIVCFLVYPSVARQAFSMLDCKEFQVLKSGRWLVSDLDKECYQGEHILYAALACVAIVVYVIGMPLALWLYLFVGYRNNGSRWLELQHSFFTASYVTHGGKWGWEFAVAIRKVLLLAVVVFVNRVAEQTYWALFLVVLMIVAQLSMAPFRTSPRNVDETVGLVGSVAIIGSLLVQGFSDSGADAVGNRASARGSFETMTEWLCLIIMLSAVSWLIIRLVFATRITRRVQGNPTDHVVVAAADMKGDGHGDVALAELSSFRTTDDDENPYDSSHGGSSHGSSLSTL